ncbi:hypothetical protein KY285_000828 [Solanum tuberosum]|nr:hypothetical protein KY289_001015 [Solanum tuberosum]KAH0764957.1 hypothetical protein KY285_000828 [Solanum tuberosum]
MSNDKYKSVEHCVIANGSKNRVSVPIFLHPMATSVIGPLKEVLQNGEKPIYKQILYADYTNIFFSKGHDGKDTEFLYLMAKKINLLRRIGRSRNSNKGKGKLKSIDLDNGLRDQFQVPGRTCY